MPSVSFDPSVDPTRLSQCSKDLLFRLLEESGNPHALITSLTRSPPDQARVMFENLERHGVAQQRALYKAPGNAVIDVYARMKGDDSADEIREAMAAKIVELGPEHVSKHCADPAKLNVIDIAPSSLAHPQAFEAAARKAVAAGQASKLLGPPEDPAYHLEIPQV